MYVNKDKNCQLTTPHESIGESFSIILLTLCAFPFIHYIGILSEFACLLCDVTELVNRALCTIRPCMVRLSVLGWKARWFTEYWSSVIPWTFVCYAICFCLYIIFVVLFKYPHHWEEKKRYFYIVVLLLI